MDKTVIYQLIGIVAMIFNIVSFQQKKQQRLILIQFFGSLLFMVHFFLMGATMGFILNGIGTIRAFVFSNKERFKADKMIWVYAFVAVFIGAYILCFTAIGMELTVQNLVIELLPVIGMTLTTVSFHMKEARNVRKLSLINSPMWLTYNVFRQSIGGTLCETFCLVSIIIGILRLDIKRENKQ